MRVGLEEVRIEGEDLVPELVPVATLLGEVRLERLLPLGQRRVDRSRRRGLLVAFEGPDGSGKTTQRKLFKTWLKSEGHKVVTSKWNSSPLIKPEA